jgi:hypothetical protein
MQFLLITLLLLLSCRDSTLPTASADICALVARPGDFDGRRVTFTAYAAPEPHYQIGLGDARCSGMIALGIPTSMNEAPEVRRLRALVWDGFPGTVNQPRATATFVGTFHVAAQGPPLRSFLLESLEHVEPVTPAAGKLR